jgi:hypothetical protein
VLPGRWPLTQPSSPAGDLPGEMCEWEVHALRDLTAKLLLLIELFAERNPDLADLRDESQHEWHRFEERRFRAFRDREFRLQTHRPTSGGGSVRSSDR